MRGRQEMTTGASGRQPTEGRLPRSASGSGLPEPAPPGSAGATPDRDRPRRLRRRIALPASPASARAARSFIHEALRGWGAAAVEDDAGLLATELVTNALRHATAPMALTLTLRQPDPHLRIAVEDHSPGGTPIRRDQDVHATDGRGLALVAEISERWGVIHQHRRGTKLVWCELVVPPDPSAAQVTTGRPAASSDLRGPSLGS